MSERVPVTVIVLTYNEEVNIKQCLQNVVGWAKEVFVLDSNSTDRTAELVQGLGAQLFFRPFDNYANQRNYAFQELPVSHNWLLFLDADEYLSDGLKAEIEAVVQAHSTEHSGYFIAFKFMFMDKWIRFGGYYPTYILRLFRRDKVKSIDRIMDEHISVEGTVGYFKHPFIHQDLKPVLSWYQKHARYAEFQANELLIQRRAVQISAGALSHQRERKRWIKERVWSIVPPFLRPFLYFFLRYFLQLGFLDGKVGFIFHFSHALWYQFMIAAVYTDKVRLMKKKNIASERTLN